MPESKPFGTDDPSISRRPTWRRLLSPGKFPGYVLAVAGIGWRVLDWTGRLDVLWQAIQAIGGTAAMIATIVASPYFSVGLVFLGIGYVIFVGEPVVGTIRHPAVPVVGWSIVGICVSFLFGLLLFGFFVSQSKIKEVISFYETSIIERHLSDKDKLLIQHELKQIKEKMPSIKIPVSAVNGLPEPMQYAGEFIDEFHNAGLLNEQANPGEAGHKAAFPVYASSTNMRGLFIGVKDKKNPPESADRLYTALWRSGILTQFADHNTLSGELEFVVGPP